VTSSLLIRVHELLTTADMPHALIGAAALAVHGVSRSTFDQDILVTDTRALTSLIWTPISDHARVDIRRGDADDPLAGVIRLSADGERDVDVVVGRHTWQRAVIDEAETLQQSPASIPVASAARPCAPEALRRRPARSVGHRAVARHRRIRAGCGCLQPD